MARVLLGVTGGIASYKACELVRLFVEIAVDLDLGYGLERERSTRPW